MRAFHVAFVAILITIFTSSINAQSNEQNTVIQSTHVESLLATFEQAVASKQNQTLTALLTPEFQFVFTPMGDTETLIQDKVEFIQGIVTSSPVAVSDESAIISLAANGSLVELTRKVNFQEDGVNITVNTREFIFIVVEDDSGELLITGINVEEIPN